MYGGINMIDCNLAVLLAERNLKITQVSKDTGISRTTLTALNSDYSGGIKFDTLNTLCNYLHITPDHFFSYLPYDYSINCEYLQNNLYSVDITIQKYPAKWVFYTATDLDIDSSDPCNFFSGTIEPSFSVDEERRQEDEKALNAFKQMYQLMTPRQKIIFKDTIVNALIACVETRLADECREFGDNLCVEICLEPITD